MANFESGVASYIHAQAVVDVYFPVDYKGSSAISCRQCKFYRDSSHRCSLTFDVCAFPDKYVGDTCPLHQVDDSTGEIII